MATASNTTEGAEKTRPRRTRKAAVGLVAAVATIGLLASPASAVSEVFGYNSGSVAVAGTYQRNGFDAWSPSISYSVGSGVPTWTTYDGGPWVAIAAAHSNGCARAIGWMNGVKGGDAACVAWA